MSNYVVKSRVDLSKTEPLNGMNYRRYIVYVLTTEPERYMSTTQTIPSESAQIDVKVTIVDVNPDPKTPPSKTSTLLQNVRAKYERNNKSVRGTMLQLMNDTLMHIYAQQKSGKTIWDML